MKPFHSHDQETAQEIARIQSNMQSTMELAILKENNGDFFEAIELYEKAQHLSYHAGEGLKVKIFNEERDLENWHRINNKIEELDKIISSKIILSIK